MFARRAVPLVAAILVLLGGRVAGAAPDCISSWETSGAVVTGAMEPRGLAVDGQGNLYATDMAGHRLVKYRCDGIVLDWWGGPGAGPGEFRGPAAVAVDETAGLFVVDCFNHRVQRFTTGGAFVLEWGSRGTGPGEFDHPSGIAVDGDGRVYVADTGNGRVQVFTGDGVPIAAWSTGGAGSGWGGGGGGRGDDVQRPPDEGEGGLGLKGAGIELLDGPRAVAVGPDGAVYVLEDDGVRKFTGEGRFLGAWDGAGPGGLAAAEGLVVGPGEMVYVADAGGARVLIYTATGHPVSAWTSTARDGGTGGGGRPGDDYERPPDGPGLTATVGETSALAAPCAVAGDARGHIFVADAGHGAVFEFAYPSVPRRAACDLDPRTVGCGVVIRSGDPVTLAVLGAPEFPSCDIDFASLVLCGGGVPATCTLADVCATPSGEDHGSIPGPDGCPDLLLCFGPEQVLEAGGIEGSSTEGEVTLVGFRRDGTPFWGAAPVVKQSGARGHPGGRPGEHYQRLEFSVPVASQVTVRVYDVAGRLVRTLDRGFRSAGDHAVTWDAGGLPSGVYFARIQSADRIESRKVVILP